MCFDEAPVSHVTMPCGRHTTCGGCAPRLAACPLCRAAVARIDSSVRTTVIERLLDDAAMSGRGMPAGTTNLRLMTHEGNIIVRRFALCVADRSDLQPVFEAQTRILRTERDSFEWQIAVIEDHLLTWQRRQPCRCSCITMCPTCRFVASRIRELDAPASGGYSAIAAVECILRDRDATPCVVAAMHWIVAKVKWARQMNRMARMSRGFPWSGGEGVVALGA